MLDKSSDSRHLDYPTLPVLCPVGGCHEKMCQTIECVVGRILDECAADDAHLYLWTTQKYLPSALDLLHKWGFNYEATMVWVKPGGPTPFSWQYNCEFVLFARKGHLRLQPEGVGQKIAFEAPRGAHSQKPDVFYERVLKASPGPRLELFARRAHEGFTAWGNEASAA